VLKAVINDMGLDDKHYKPNIVRNRISSAKNALMGPVEYAMNTFIQQEDARSKRPAIGEIYAAYAARCFKNGAMDFDDLLFKMHELLRDYPVSIT
jgi:DNA helicase-2/ATP-dependent DNA helicase PcrA